jgi:hypothetical protein
MQNNYRHCVKKRVFTNPTAGLRSGLRSCLGSGLSLKRALSPRHSSVEAKVAFKGGPLKVRQRPARLSGGWLRMPEELKFCQLVKSSREECSYDNPALAASA